jgi:hypothetical protein
MLELKPFYNIDLRLTKVLQLGGARHLDQLGARYAF